MDQEAREKMYLVSSVRLSVRPSVPPHYQSKVFDCVSLTCIVQEIGACSKKSYELNLFYVGPLIIECRMQLNELLPYKISPFHERFDLYFYFIFYDIILVGAGETD